MKYPALFASDLHGNRYAYDRLFKLAVERGIKTVILGGDLTPKWPVISFYGRTVIPLDPRIFASDENGYTYDAFLGRLEPSVVGRNRKAEEHYVRLGGHQVFVQDQLDWKTLRLQQRVLRLMIEEFMPAKRFLGREPGDGLRLTPEEFDCLEELLSRLPAGSIRLAAGITLRDVILSVRYRMLTKEEQRALLEFQASWGERLKLELNKLPPAARQCFRGRESPRGEPRNGHSGDFQHVEPLCVTAASNHSLHACIETYKGLSKAAKPQKSFLEQVLNRCIRKFKQELPGAQVFLILGNDDVVENEAVVKRMHARDAITLIDRQPVEVAPGLSIVGYPFVRDSGGRFYAGWEKSEDDILRELSALESQAGNPAKTVFVVHSPPAFTKLDQSFGDQHFGSEGVRDWLRRGKKRLVLSGHIHEAPFVGGDWREVVDGTPCIQPGAWHDEDLCAAIVDLADPADAEWIVDRSKIRA